MLQFIDSTKFMASSLSDCVNNLSEGIHKIKCKHGHDDKKCEIGRTKYKYCDCFLEYTNFKDDLWEHKCLCYNINYQQKFDVKLEERFFNTYKPSNHDSNKVILLLSKGVCFYEYVDDWEKFNEASFPCKEGFYSHLNMEDIIYADYTHLKTVCKDFERKHLRGYHDFCAHGLYLRNFKIYVLKIWIWSWSFSFSS